MNAHDWFNSLSINEQLMWTKLHPYYRNFGSYYVREVKGGIPELYRWVQDNSFTDEEKAKSMVAVLWERGYSAAQIEANLGIKIDLDSVNISDLNNALLNGNFSIVKE